jgi:ubiquitin carboxyl-terminal hydrolase 4/11/15
MVLMSIMEMSVLEGFFRNTYSYYVILFFSVSCFICLLSIRIINAMFFFWLNRWWQSWIDYLIQDLTGATSNGYHHHEFGSKTPRRPGAIDNTDLIDDASFEISNTEIEIHDNLVEGRDYILLPQQVWEKLHGW